jgi:hypothetical protein
MQRAGRSIAKILNWALLALGVVVGAAGLFMAAVAAAFAFVPAVRAEMLRQAAEVGDSVPPITTVWWALPMIVAILALACLLLFRLRKVIVTVERGDPFHPENPRNLRIIALLLALIEISRTGLRLFVPDSPVSVAEDVDSWFVAWLSVLIVFVLAEVFREGSRLRDDADLTV